MRKSGKRVSRKRMSRKRISRKRKKQTSRKKLYKMHQFYSDTGRRRRSRSFIQRSRDARNRIVNYNRLIHSLKITLKQSIIEKIISDEFLWDIFTREEDMDFNIVYECTDIVNGENVLNFGFMDGPENVNSISVFLDRGVYEFEVEPIYRLGDNFQTFIMGDFLR